MTEKTIVSRNTKQKSSILKILKQKAAPVSAAEVLKMAKSKVPDINKTTVYRVLDRLVQEELVDAVNLKAGLVHYELASHEHHHHHFVCNICNNVTCLEGCPAELKSLLPRGFQMTGHDLTIRGLCPKCK